MGCGGSSRVEKPTEFEIEKTGVQDVDLMFDEVTAPIKRLHHAYEGLNKALRDLKQLTGTFILKDHKVEDSIEGMLICLLASVAGDYDKLDLKFKNSNPFVTLSRHALAKEHLPIMEAWDKLTKNILELPDELITLGEEVVNIVKNANTYPDRAREAMSSASLAPLEAIKATKAVASNVAKIAQAAKTLEEFRQTLNGTIAAVTALVTKLDSDSERNRLKELGKAAAAAKLLDPKKIIESHWADKVRIELKPGHK
jgi:hypothetical protein